MLHPRLSSNGFKKAGGGPNEGPLWPPKDFRQFYFISSCKELYSTTSPTQIAKRSSGRRILIHTLPSEVLETAFSYE